MKLANRQRQITQKQKKVDQYKYLGQILATEDRTANETQLRIKAGWLVFGKYKEIFENKDLPINLKRKVFNQCILPTLTYVCLTWTLVYKRKNVLIEVTYFISASFNNL